MAKVSVVVVADTETHGELGRVLNALTLVQEAADAGDQVELVLDGAGVKWVPVLSDPEHKVHALFQRLRPHIAGACAYCAAAFGVKDDVSNAGVELLNEYHGHPSLRQRIADGYAVLTF